MNEIARSGATLIFSKQSTVDDLLQKTNGERVLGINEQEIGAQRIEIQQKLSDGKIQFFYRPNFCILQYFCIYFY